MSFSVWLVSDIRPPALLPLDSRVFLFCSASFCAFRARVISPLLAGRWAGCLSTTVFDWSDVPLVTAGAEAGTGVFLLTEAGGFFLEEALPKSVRSGTGLVVLGRLSLPALLNHRPVWISGGFLTSFTSGTGGGAGVGLD